jgi:hypothetical protein
MLKFKNQAMQTFWKNVFANMLYLKGVEDVAKTIKLADDATRAVQESTDWARREKETMHEFWKETFSHVFVITLAVNEQTAVKFANKATQAFQQRCGWEHTEYPDS